MEKHKTIKEVREGVVDEDFKTRWEKQVSTGLKETALLLKDCWNGCWCVERLYGGIIFYSYNNFVSIQSDLILRMMSEDPNDRPTAENILTMDILSEKNKVIIMELTCY